MLSFMAYRDYRLPNIIRTSSFITQLVAKITLNRA